MKPISTSEENLKTVIFRLGDLADKLTFVGGATVGLYITQPQVVSMRATFDVDAVVEVASQVEYDKLRRALQSRGFSQRIGEEVICRYFHGDLILDVMPDDELILGFSNRWYKAGIQSRIQFEFSGCTINTFAPVFLVASKMEAFRGRGKNDYYASHDIEDVVNIFDGRPEIVEEIKRDTSKAGQWIRMTLSAWLGNEVFGQAVEGHISDRQNSGGRRDIVLARMREATCN